MPVPSFDPGAGRAVVSRPLVQALFVSSCLLAVVSWYTTYQGMALYLSPWFALLASLGIQSALVFVAWLVGFTRTRRALLICVYAATAVVSIAFSYASLYTWFSSRERPAEIARSLYDRLTASSGKAQELLAAGISEGAKHVLALDEMTQAEKSHGYIARAQDADPYLARAREAVAREAQTYDAGYREGAGAGLRYTAFERYGKLARQSLERMKESQRALAELSGRLKPLDSTENQLRVFREVYDAVPWQEVKEQAHLDRFVLPDVPAYSEFVDRLATGQEDLLIAFGGLVSSPGPRHLFAFLLAAFIDIVIFLLAYAAGPYFFGAPEQRWLAAGAALDSCDEQVFVRNFLRKAVTGPQGLARVNVSDLTPGEQQLCVLLAAHGQAALSRDGDRSWYLLEQEIHRQMVESLSRRCIQLQAQGWERA